MASAAINARLIVLQRQLPRLVADVQREVARTMKRKAQEEATRLFATQAYIGPSGNRTALKPNSERWNATKAAKGLDMRLGHAHGRLARAIDQMVKLTPDRKGIKLSLQAAAARTGAGDYYEFYANMKAPGLGERISNRLEQWWGKNLKQRIRQRARLILGTSMSFTTERLTDERIRRLIRGQAVNVSRGA